MTKYPPLAYNTKNQFKHEEAGIILKQCLSASGEPFANTVEFSFTDKEVKETLEVDIERMVTAEVRLAYQQLLVPCIVEHAGLIFDEYATVNYPGGLTKPMWNTLGEKFVQETQSAGRNVTAKAVVAYCDGMSIRTFVGETRGVLANEPRGDRNFYWDTIFIPLDDNPQRLTYAQIVARDGLEAKVLKHSQSRKAMVQFLNFLAVHQPKLWRITY